jgi:hypothetical protein
MTSCSSTGNGRVSKNSGKEVSERIKNMRKQSGEGICITLKERMEVKKQ